MDATNVLFTVISISISIILDSCSAKSEVLNHPNLTKIWNSYSPQYGPFIHHNIEPPFTKILGFLFTKMWNSYSPKYQSPFHCNIKLHNLGTPIHHDLELPYTIILDSYSPKSEVLNHPNLTKIWNSYSPQSGTFIHQNQELPFTKILGFLFTKMWNSYSTKDQSPFHCCGVSLGTIRRNNTWARFGD